MSDTTETSIEAIVEAKKRSGLADFFGKLVKDKKLGTVGAVITLLFLVTAISWLYGKAFAPESRWQRANLAPLLGAIFDYLENLSTSLVMLRYPQQTPVVDLLAPLFTALKWGFLGASFLLLFAGILFAIWRWAAGRAGGRGFGPNDTGSGA